MGERSLPLWVYRGLLTAGLPVAIPALWIRDRATGKKRPPWRERFSGWRGPATPGGLWIQAVSVGEVEVARRVIAELERHGSPLPLLLTATTATGLSLARRTLASKIPVYPCPVDLPGPVRRAFARIQPRLFVLVETELWPEMIARAGKLQTPVAVINARLSERSFARYWRIRGLVAPLLEPVTRVLARSETDAERFERLGIHGDRIHITGNLKYDLVADETPLPWGNRVDAWAADRPVLVAGSTMEGEEAAVLDALTRIPAKFRPFLILAPRHPERFDVAAATLAARGLVVARRSALGEAPGRPDALLLDTIGELGRAYRFADVAFVGGSLVPTGGHNPLEPAAWGTPVLTGPHVFNFEEIYDELVAAGAVRIVSATDELASVLMAWLTEPDAAAARGAAGLRVVEANRGAASRTVAELLELAEAGTHPED